MTSWYVNPDIVGGSDDGTTPANAWSTLASAFTYFAGLSSGGAGDDHQILCTASSGSIDSGFDSAFNTYTISYFYTTGYSLTIAPNTGDESDKTGLDTSKYRIGGYGFRLNVGELHILNIQIALTQRGHIQLENYGETSDHEIGFNYFQNDTSADRLEYFILDDISIAASTMSVHDNVFFANGQTHWSHVFVNARPSDLHVYNNVMEGQTATYGSVYISSGYSGDYIIKNNKIVNSNDDINDAGSSGATTVQYNAADDDLDTEFSEATNIQPSNWANELSDYANGDMTHVTSGQTNNAGVGPSSDANVSTTDIDGDSRSGSSCDIGPDEFVASGSTVTVICADGVAFTISNIGNGTFNAQAIDAIGMNDTDIGPATMLAQSTDAFSFDDWAGGLGAVVVTASDVVTLGDNAIGLFTAQGVSGDGFAIGEALTVQIQVVAQALDGVNMDDSALVFATMLAVATDGVAIDDSSLATTGTTATGNVTVTFSTQSGTISLTVQRSGAGLTEQSGGASLTGKTADSTLTGKKSDSSLSGKGI